MLVLSRHEGERIHIGDEIVITLVSIDGNRVRVGIEAPPEIAVLRKELYDRLKTESSNHLMAIRHPR